MWNVDNSFQGWSEIPCGTSHWGSRERSCISEGYHPTIQLVWHFSSAFSLGLHSLSKPTCKLYHALPSCESVTKSMNNVSNNSLKYLLTLFRSGVLTSTFPETCLKINVTANAQLLIFLIKTVLMLISQMLWSFLNISHLIPPNVVTAHLLVKKRIGLLLELCLERALKVDSFVLLIFSWVLVYLALGFIITNYHLLILCLCLSVMFTHCLCVLAASNYSHILDPSHSNDHLLFPTTLQTYMQ